jgi:flagellar hook-associated protein 1 FlgK
LGLSGVMSSALSTLQVNSEGLRVVSENVANLNTTGYARRVLNEQTSDAGGGLVGVDVADVARVVNQYLTQQTLSAGGASSSADAQNTIFTQLNGFLGTPGDGNSVSTQLGNVFSALEQAQLSPTSSISQQSVVSSMQNFASTVSQLSGQIQSLQASTDQQVTAQVASANSLIQQIYQLNTQIGTQSAEGDDASALQDQRDTAIQSLSQIVGIKTVQQPNGQVAVMTGDGVSLVGDSYAQLSYGGGAGDSYPSITVQSVSGSSGLPVGPPQSFDSHLTGGSLQGLVQMRDTALAGLNQQLGEFAQTTAQAFNQISNQSAAYPPPSTLTGQNTGLLSTDSIGFTGQTTIGITDLSGNLQHTVSINFDTGTIVADGSSFGFSSNLGNFASTLNSAMTSVGGSANFNNGVLSLGAGSGQGLAIQDNATTPSDRGGEGFSQFFGLNNLFTTAAPMNTATGLSATDASGFAAGQGLTLSLEGPNGEVAKTAQVTMTAGMTIGNVVSALNTAMGGAETFTLNADGSLSATPSAANAGYQLQVSNDSTSRGTTGVSLSQLFGLGGGNLATAAQTFQVTPSLVSSPALLPLATPSALIFSNIGTQVVSHGDFSGGTALEGLQSATQNFGAAGSASAQSATLGDYATGFYQTAATLAQDASDNKTNADAGLTDAQSAQSNYSGVNLDEELTSMLSYQQAYSAGARMLTVVDQLYNSLMQVQ